MASSLHEPSPRYHHFSVQVQEQSYLWGGCTRDNSRSEVIHILDAYIDNWKERSTSGVPPPGLYGASTLLCEDIYYYGGLDIREKFFFNTLHKLQTRTLEWQEIARNDLSGAPQPKAGCGMVAYQQQLALIGGYGPAPTGPLQSGAEFFKSTNDPSCGWTNEFHLFNVKEGKWSSPPTTGPRPPPNASFTFTAINEKKAVYFGGYRGVVNDVHIIDFTSMVWTRLEKPQGAPWPVGRFDHAACCLNYGDNHPVLLMTGGVDQNFNTLDDAWLLDVHSGRWKELTLPEGTQPRYGHTLTACNMDESRVHATTFGGSPSYGRNTSYEDDRKLAHTTVLEFESVQSGDDPSSRQWVLVGVADSSQKTEHEVQQAQRQSQTLQVQRDAARQRLPESEQSLQASQQAQLATQRSVQALKAQNSTLEVALQQSQADKRDLLERATTAEHSVREAGEYLQILQRSLDEANTQAVDLQRRVQAAERRAEDAERRAEDAERRAEDAERRAEDAERRAEEAGPEEMEAEANPLWVVRRDEIILTTEELGRGGWAVVRVARFRKTRVAAKCLYGQIVSDYNRSLFIREMNMAARVRHPNLLQFIGATLRGELIILTELMPTSVRRELENEHTFPPNLINSISLDVARALNYLHLMHPTPIIHRDISSANVLLEPGPNNSWRAKVSDYGSVNLLERLRTAAPGNPTYAAPEVQNVALQSPKMDIFSFGVLLVEMCSARFPEVDHRQRLIRSIRNPSMVALIRRCLAEDRNARPSASVIITELNEPQNP